jgi:hypothetical protein
MRNDFNQKQEYTLHFDPTRAGNSTISFLDHNSHYNCKLEISIFDQDFKYRSIQEFPSIIADLIDLSVAIHASDRLSEQKLDQGQTYINVILPVQNFEHMNATRFQEKLADLLEWATGSRWSFTFKKRDLAERIIEQQQVLPITIPQDCEISLWSGGLDALAGLYTRLKNDPERSFLLFGTGSSDTVYKRQKVVFNALNELFPNRLYLCRVPIRFSGSNSFKKNKISRARGVVFTLLGSACAYLMNQNTLYLYENGIGAINLPYLKSGIGLDHSRSVHPLTLLKVSDVISELFGKPFAVNNPFLFWTKAKMCKLLSENQALKLVGLTMSCDSPHRKQPIQCGYCSSCLLRKQSLSASMIEDATRYVVPHAEKPKGDITLHFRHMREQILTLKKMMSNSDSQDDQWEALTRIFTELEDIVDRIGLTENMTVENVRGHIINLYQSHIDEWDISESRLSGDISI